MISLSATKLGCIDPGSFYGGHSTGGHSILRGSFYPEGGLSIGGGGERPRNSHTFCIECEMLAVTTFKSHNDSV